VGNCAGDVVLKEADRPAKACPECLPGRVLAKFRGPKMSGGAPIRREHAIGRRASAFGAIGREKSDGPEDDFGLDDEGGDAQRLAASGKEEGIQRVDGAEKPGAASAQRSALWVANGSMLSLIEP